MKSNLLRGVILFSILATSLIPIGCGNEPIATPYVAEEFVVCNASGNQASPRISSNIVVWSDFRNIASEAEGFVNTDIYAYNLTERHEFPICTDCNNAGYPDIDGDIVVWADYRNDNSKISNFDIYGYNLLTENEFVICKESHEQGWASISGNIVVWSDTRRSNNTSDIYGYNLSSDEEFPISTYLSLNSTYLSSKMFPSIYQDTVTWLDFRKINLSAHRQQPETVLNTEIYAYNLSSGLEFAITDDEYMQDPPGADIYSNTMVWSEGHQDEGLMYIYSYDIATQTKSVLITSRDSLSAPVIYGDIVVWNDYRNDNGDIYGYNMKTGEEFAICTDPGQQQNPAIYGNIVIWEDDREEVANTYDIYGARLTFDNP